MAKKLARDLTQLVEDIDVGALKAFRSNHTIDQTRKEFNLTDSEFFLLQKEYDLTYNSKFAPVDELVKIISKDALIDLCISKSRKDIAEMYNTSETNITKLREFYGIKGISEIELLCFKINKKELETYYSTHSFKDAQTHFELNDSAARKIFKLYNIHLRDYQENISAGTPQPKRPKKKWITNGEVEYLINIDEPIPEGWTIGISEARKEKISNTEKGNPKSEHQRQALKIFWNAERNGKHWYTDGEHDGLFEDGTQPEGWIKGQGQMRRNKNSEANLGKKMSEASLDKRLDTLRKNNTFCTSQPESYLKNMLKFMYSDIETEYKCERYPYRCDIYIPRFDLFIEVNGHPSHGLHPFNPDNPGDLSKLSVIQSKKGTYWSQSYKKLMPNRYIGFEDTWTRKDPIKLKTAKENNLNYLAIYNITKVNMVVFSLIDFSTFKNFNVIDAQELYIKNKKDLI